MDASLLQNRDYTIIIAKTAASVVKEPPGYEHRWHSAYESIINLVRACQKFDTDGVTMYVSCRDSKDYNFQQYKHIMPDKLREIVEAHYPPYELDLLGVLQKALDDYFTRKAANQAKPNGEIIIVLIDGEPLDRMAIAKTIVEATHKLDNSRELGIGFVQVGSDLLARGFLKALDEDLTHAGAYFDIVDTKMVEDLQANSLLQFLFDTLDD
ncbi:von Willebrand factor type A [Calothrix sp. NIES-4071]|nr:von Willebrand factor type A [Calothrix sp. NIES-4071]BAZ63029.1 von Willebrand factor type A [Calothrix sp. NIES-4105]